MMKRLPPMHPGEVLREELLIPLDLSAGKTREGLRPARTRIERIINEHTGITALVAGLGRI
jgi:addiction module HigA family antidote